MNQNEVSFKFKNSVTGEKKLKEYAETLSKIQSISKGMDKATLTQINDGAKNVSKFNNETSKTETIISKAFNLGKINMFVSGLKSAVKTIGALSAKSADYTENLNLYSVAFDGATKSADKFVNKLTEMYGLDESWLVRTTGIFKQLSNAMALSTEQGTKLATLMTQMSIDISSLYNIDIDRASSVLQSSLAGQTKPIRGATGGDITQATLQTTLDSLGIDKYIGDLSYAEKRLVIIISLTQQLKEATNDFGKTIESPANQTRILGEQWERLSRAVGNLFLPTISKILPYLNAVLMVLTEIINTVAGLLGFDLGEYDYGVSGVTDSVLDLEDSLNGATSSASKLKKEMSGLRSFDKLNVIKTPTSASGSGGASGTGISPDLINAFDKAFDEYNNKLENVRMKANDIRDSIMEWLGFTKKINPLTGDISWEYQGISKTLKNMWQSFKKLTPEGKVLLGIFTAIFATKMFNMGKKIVSLFGNSGLLKWIVKLNSPFGNLLKNMKDYIKYAPSLGSGIKTAIDDWQAQLTTMEKVQGVMAGIVSAGTGMLVIKTSMDSINESGLNLLNTLGLVGGGLSTVIGGVQIGATLGGGTGAIIGGITGVVVTLIETMLLYEDEMDKAVKKSEEQLNVVKKQQEEMKNTSNQIYQELSYNLAVTNEHEKLLSELDQIVDANGKIKDGYSSRAKFILNELSNAYGVEYQLTGDILKNSEEYIEQIKKRIKLKETEYLLDAGKKDYLKAIERETELYDSLSDAQNELKNAQEKLKDLQKEQILLIGDTSKTIAQQNIEYENLTRKINSQKDTIENLQEAEKTATENYKKNNEIKMRYSDLYTAVEEENYEKITKAKEEYVNSYVKDNEVITLSETERINKMAQDRAIELENLRKNEKEKYDAHVKTLTDIQTYINGVTPDIAFEWASMSKLSKEQFLTNLGTLPSDIQTEIVDKMKDKGYSISKELQEGIDELNPTVEVKMDTTKADKKIKVDADVSSAQKKTENLWTKVRKALLNSFSISLPALNFAKGGMPPVGQLFVANERGPELVGHIGGQSFVANQNQMMDLLDKKIGNSSSGVQNATFVINVGSKKIAEQVLTDLEDMAKSNGKPITING